MTNSPDTESAPFDPRTVPVFPRLAMEIDTQLRTVSLDGMPVPVEGDDDLFDTAVAAAAARIKDRKLDHARVAAVVDADRYTLVIGAQGDRHSLDEPEGKKTRSSSEKRPVWPLLVGAAVLMLILSTLTGVAIAVHQRSTQADTPTAPPVPPPAGELPIVPTDAWTTRAAWSIPLHANPGQAEVVLTDSSIVTITPNQRLTALDPETGIEQWTSAIRGTVDAGPVSTVIDGQQVIAIVTNKSLLWWPETGSPTPVGEIALDNQEEVSFAGEAPLITGRGQLARVIDEGTPADRTIPAGASALRADAGTVLAVNSLGDMWRLSSTDTYVPDPTPLRGPEGVEGSVSVVGTSGDVFALQWSVLGGSTTLLYDLKGEPVGKPVATASRTWEASPASPWATSGAALINTAKGTHRTLNAGNWRTLSIGPEIYGRTGQAIVQVDPATGHLTEESNPDATPPITSGDRLAYYAAEDNDGQSRLYAVEGKPE